MIFEKKVLNLSKVRSKGYMYQMYMYQIRSSTIILSNKIKREQIFLTFIRAFHIFSSSLFNTPCFTQNNIK